MGRPVVFASDYGLADEFVGVCHGVVARISPGSRIIDLTHSLPHHDVATGAVVVAQCAPYMPEDAVYLVVVDPGVGTPRRAVAVRTAAGAHLVGPDNGVLSLAWLALGGPAAVQEVTSDRVLLQPVSATFHGRDVFAPAAGWLAAGRDAVDLGPSVDPNTLIAVRPPAADVEGGKIRCRVLSVDGFGNVQLTATGESLGLAGLTPGQVVVRTPTGPVEVRLGVTFADASEGPVLLQDSRGWLALVLFGRSVAQAYGLSPGDEVVLAAGPA